MKTNILSFTLLSFVIACAQNQLTPLPKKMEKEAFLVTYEYLFGKKASIYWQKDCSGNCTNTGCDDHPTKK